MAPVDVKVPSTLSNPALLSASLVVVGHADPALDVPSRPIWRVKNRMQSRRYISCRGMYCRGGISGLVFTVLAAQKSRLPCLPRRYGRSSPVEPISICPASQTTGSSWFDMRSQVKAYYRRWMPVSAQSLVTLVFRRERLRAHGPTKASILPLSQSVRSGQ